MKLISLLWLEEKKTWWKLLQILDKDLKEICEETKIFGLDKFKLKMNSLEPGPP